MLKAIQICLVRSVFSITANLNIKTRFIICFPGLPQGVTFKFNIILRWLYLAL